MAVISVTVTESTEQIVSGFPRFVTITTNIPSTIFYTLDGTVPNLFSTIYTGTISLPTDSPTLVLNILASNGIDSSPIITQTFQTDVLGQNARFSHSGTDAQPNISTQGADPYPFGTNPIQPNAHFLGPAEAGLNVDDPTLVQVPSGFDGDGNPTGFTNGQSPGIPTKTFPIQFTDKDFDGEQGDGIGTLPRSSIEKPSTIPEQSNIDSPLFDPRSLVIFQDATVMPDPNQPPHINRMHFTLEDVEHTRQGNQFFNTGLDAPPVSGTFLRQHFNPRDNTMTYYYIDTTQNKWIISKQPFAPSATIANYAGSMMFANRQPGSRRVFSWIPFKGNYLY